MKALHQKNLLPASTRHKDIENHLLSLLFEQAEKNHLQSHVLMNSWIMVDWTEAKKEQILDFMWVYVYKFDKHGCLLKCKARLVVWGDQQIKITEDIYVIILAAWSFWIIMMIVICFNLELKQYNAVNAFVHASLSSKIYMWMLLEYHQQGKNSLTQQDCIQTTEVIRAVAVAVHRNPHWYRVQVYTSQAMLSNLQWNPHLLLCWWHCSDVLKISASRDKRTIQLSERPLQHIQRRRSSVISRDCNLSELYKQTHVIKSSFIYWEDCETSWQNCFFWWNPDDEGWTPILWPNSDKAIYTSLSMKDWITALRCCHNPNRYSLRSIPAS